MIEFEHKPRSRNIFDPTSEKPFKLSRSKIEDFVRCPRCFYLDRRLAVGPPSTPGFTLNTAVDELLKKEFDEYRALGEPHPLMVEHEIDAVPFQHDHLDDWRSNFKGVQVHHRSTNFIITGAVDDVWINPAGELIVVDYKATSINGSVTEKTHLRASYRRQLDIYQWLLREAGFTVASVGYFVYANGRKDRARFDNTLDFEVKILTYRGDCSWVEPRLHQARACLSADEPPPPSSWCEYCAYRSHARDAFAST
ncbi:MAG TPA: PD-(D/E)XK nuclease family protein [candidate division Zixibacteria bacterium]|nr:PD-(D/E)XK nuclease family protein [candidate division Zixibacteria bacterium]